MVIFGFQVNGGWMGVYTLQTWVDVKMGFDMSHFVRELLSEWNLLLPCFFIVVVAVAFESSVIVAEGVCWNAS